MSNAKVGCGPGCGFDHAMGNFLEALRHWRFSLLWGGLTISSLGDSLTRLALIWLTYHLKGSAADVGILITCYSAPVILGGPLAGLILDRLGPRRAMLADNLVRGVMVGLIPVLFHAGALQPWHLYIVAAIYGLLRMITLAGAPTILPLILPAARLNAANALEMLSYSISNVVGPAVAGLLLAVISGADVLAFDALSYFLLVACLFAIGPVAAQRPEAGQARGSEGLGPAVSFSVGNRFIRNSTLMYMTLNIGRGVLDVLVPVLLLRIPGASSRTLGLVAAIEAIGELAGSFLSGALKWGLPYPRLIAWSLGLGGIPLLVLGRNPRWLILAVVLAASSLIEAPLTVWAQTERMRLIPPGLRGRVFALLRTVMQFGPALGGILGAQMVGALPVQAVVALIFMLMSGPGLTALFVPRLLERSTPPAEQVETV